MAGKTGYRHFNGHGGGAVIISQNPSDIKLTSATVGKVSDLGITDPFDMGSAMAPAPPTQSNSTCRT